MEGFTGVGKVLFLSAMQVGTISEVKSFASGKVKLVNKQLVNHCTTVGPVGPGTILLLHYIYCHLPVTHVPDGCTQS